MIEGLPGAGKSTMALNLANGLASRQQDVNLWAEGRTDHPVDFEQVSVLTKDDLERILAEFPASRELLLHAVVAEGDVWLVRLGQHDHLPSILVQELRRYDSYDGRISPDVHSKVLTESWRRFGRVPVLDAVQIWECVLIQNPVCAFIARFDQAPEVLERHVLRLIDAVGAHGPALVYLDPGDPEQALKRAAAERPAEWLQAVIAYHTQQGYGLRHGLTGFDGYIEFMRQRREIELDLLPRLPLPTLLVNTDEGTWNERTARVQTFTEQHLGLSPLLSQD